MIETKTANIYIKDGVLFLVYKDKAVIGINEIRENLEARIKLQGGEKVLAFVDVRKVWSYSEEARALVGGNEFKDITLAMAVVVGYSLPVKIIANFFMRFNKPNYPTKLFKKEENAIKWLKNYR
ncbi:MAG: hypothetical protein ACPGSO_04430 [Vicingaceae bacterium]